MRCALFRPDARQLAELVDQILDRSLEHGEGQSPGGGTAGDDGGAVGGPPRPPASAPNRSCATLGDLRRSVGHGADDQVLQGLEIPRVDDLGVDVHRDQLAAALDDDLDQTSTCLAMYLSVGELAAALP